MIGNLIKRYFESYFIAFPFNSGCNLVNIELSKGNDSNKKKNNNYIRQKRKSKNKHEIIWINNPHYYEYLFDPVNIEQITSTEKNIFISCSDGKIATILAGKKFETLRVGKEAVLDFNKEHFGKTRIKELIKAGLRYGKIKEYYYDNETAENLEKFKSVCSHGDEPQIKCFFNDKLTGSNRLFIFENFTGSWLGALMLSEAPNKKIKTDLLLRRKDAPNGVMETLIYGTFSRLKNEGFKLWSLGEVPYIIYDSRFFSKEFWINFIGRKTKFAYNYSGLFKFKNKFNPEWNDVYICTKKRLNLFFLLRILVKSNLIVLVLYKSILLFSQFGI